MRTSKCLMKLKKIVKPLQPGVMAYTGSKPDRLRPDMK